MTKFRRTIIFFSFMIVFILVVPAVLLYSQGYRLDLEKKQLTRVGGLYLKTSHGGAKVFINDKFRKETDLFLRRVFISDLMPKTYNIKIKRDGYHVWEKNLEIKPEKVTEARNILLVANDPKKELMADKVQNFIFAPDKKNIAYLASENEIVILNNQTKEIIFQDKLPDRKASQIQIISWSPDSKKILLGEEEESENLSQLQILYLEKDLLEPLVIPIKIKELHWHPSDQYSFLLKRANLRTKTDELLWYDYKTGKFSQPIAQEVACFNISGESINFAQKSSGLIFKVDFRGSSKKQVLPSPVNEIKESSSCQIQNYGADMLLIAGGNFYVIDEESRKIKKHGENIIDTRFSSMGKSLIFWSGNELWVYYLKDVLLQPFKLRGDKDLITRFGEKINEVHWYTEDNEHLIFRIGNKIKITELDGRDQRNTVDFINLKDTEDEKTRIFYNDRDELLYFLEDNNLYRVEIK